MDANTWYMISIAGYSAALIGVIVSTVLFFKLHIVAVIGDLSGRTVARELKSMRENRNTRSVKYNPGMRRLNKTGARTGRTGRMSRRTGGVTGGLRRLSFTGRISGRTGENASAVGAMQSDKQVLHSNNGNFNGETEKLYEDFDPMVEYASPGTALLYPAERENQYEGTMLLEDVNSAITEDLVQCVKFSITRSYLIVHSEESIIEK